MPPDCLHCGALILRPAEGGVKSPSSPHRGITRSHFLWAERSSSSTPLHPQEDMELSHLLSRYSPSQLLQFLSRSKTSCASTPIPQAKSQAQPNVPSGRVPSNISTQSRTSTQVRSTIPCKSMHSTTPKAPPPQDYIHRSEMEGYQLEASLDIGGCFPDHGLEVTTPQNPEESPFGGFLGLPKESFDDTFDPFGDLLRGKFYRVLDPSQFCFFWSSGLVGDPTPLEETVESDSERGE
ncbi:hypothetical protein Taro_028944 [Colocasia esculenta]|uniref:Uncharacterized protein n=1 Tax=Colocasia esculenta TaxID=4460 RepID=A0A843VTE7_COLES|nr:hypothetical protein [Colocasia esculenta]